MHKQPVSIFRDFPKTQEPRSQSPHLPLSLHFKAAPRSIIPPGHRPVHGWLLGPTDVPKCQAIKISMVLIGLGYPVLSV